MDYYTAQNQMEIDMRKMDDMLLECLKKFKSDIDMKPVLRVMKERIEKHRLSIETFEEKYCDDLTILST